MTLGLTMSSESQINEQTNRFLTYSNYVSALAAYLKSQLGNDPSGFEAVFLSRSFRAIQGRRCRESERVRLLLRSAWLSEIQLSLSAQLGDLVAYANHWAPVQLYYAVYLELRALLLASNQSPAEDHTSTLRAITGEIERRPKLFPLPWRITCTGDPDNVSLRFNNLPPGVSVMPVSSLASPHFTPFWDFFGLFLKTTRARRLETSIEEWKRRNPRRRIKAEERRVVSIALAPTSIFPCLYRLRLRSNYADAESFLVSLGNSFEAERFHSGLRRICWCTLLVLAILISRYVGVRTDELWLGEFAARDRRGLGARLVRGRWSAISSIRKRCERES